MNHSEGLVKHDKSSPSRSLLGLRDMSTPTEEDATHTGKVELPAWSIDSVAHGEMQRSMCC
ncbi:unnamed protein product [Plutella xylostella]|uniref:(diamondback moth) hypothetical protein n=1 Tax=Plutella xylostella TaxID=51655 RepID=A0A8S4G1E9_PLUXY|nr:unnamed protein product [Plutella xylostella]